MAHAAHEGILLRHQRPQLSDELLPRLRLDAAHERQAAHVARDKVGEEQHRGDEDLARQRGQQQRRQTVVRSAGCVTGRLTSSKLLLDTVLAAQGAPAQHHASDQVTSAPPAVRTPQQQPQPAQADLELPQPVPSAAATTHSTCRVTSCSPAPWARTIYHNLICTCQRSSAHLAGQLPKQSCSVITNNPRCIEATSAGMTSFSIVTSMTPPWRPAPPTGMLPPPVRG